jgi:hypothetical protein
MTDTIETEITIEAITRPIMAAYRVLRDYQADRYSRMSTDDPPSAAAIRQACEAVQQAMAMVVTAENVKAVVEQMAGGKSVTVTDLIDAVVNRDALSIALDGHLPLAAVSMAASRCRGKSLDTGGFSALSPETFLRSCIREQRAIEELVERLIAARNMTRSRR